MSDSTTETTPTTNNQQESSSATATATTPTLEDIIVQYIVIRSDLKWSKGALITQCCHASTSSIHLFYNDSITKRYLDNLDNMHKVVLSSTNLDDLNELNKTLLLNNIKFKLWIEQPENIPTCLATKPYPKKEIEQFFKKFKLFR